MSKLKMIMVIQDRFFECLQRLSIAAYSNEMKNNYFDFESYFELSFNDSAKYVLEFLKIDDYEPYRNVFRKYFKKIYNLAIDCATRYITAGLSNRKTLFEYWKNNKKKIAGEIVDVYKENLK